VGEQAHPSRSSADGPRRGTVEDMTVTAVANPRRTSLASLARGSELATCQAADGHCRNVAVLVVKTPEGRALLCRAHAAH
jgi:hypothetical protein